MEEDYKFYDKMLQTALSAGLPVLSSDTCARILAVIYGYGNNEAYALSPKLRADLRYIKDRFNIKGGSVPDVGFAETLQFYVDELKHYNDSNKDRSHAYPDWATRLFKRRYGIKLIN